jgi:tRNA A-37 threonylcarbamoyl transferase component Bud32/FlaG/FlaF family flagellin (archaellin)
VGGDFPLASQEPVPVRVGSQVSGYRLEEQIGRGGMAVVYRAIDTRLDRSVALKVLAPELVRDEAFRQRFIRESRAAAAVDHPCIIPVFDAGETDGVLFIAMRFVAGRDVRSLLDRDGTLPAWRTVTIIDQVASALDAAHDRGLVHRDVKPANMLLDTGGPSGQFDHVYLSDFGLTKHSLSTSSLTGSGQFLGTLDYIAPEQIEGRTIDGRADEYSLACAAYEMLAGSPPFKRDQSVAVMWAQISAPPPRLTEQRPDLPPEVDAVMARAMAKKPADRYRTCLEFAAALRAACEVTGRPAVPAQGPVGEGLPAEAVLDPPTAAAGLGVVSPDRASQRAGAAGAPGLGHPSLGQPMVDAILGPPAPGSALHPDSLYRPVRSPSPVPGPRPPAGPRPGAGPRPPAGRPPAGPPPRRPWYRSPGVIAVACMVAVAAVVAAVLFSRNSGGGTASPPVTSGSPSTGTSGSPSPSTPGSPSPAVPRTPSGTVTAYFAALNAHNYRRAWKLGGQNTGSSYSTYVQGYSDTESTQVTVLSVSQDVVTADITAHQTDGTLKTFQGTYTVSGGAIIQFNVHQTG